METVYYCSSIGGLKIIDATVLETGNNVLVGCTSKIASILNFVGKNNDFIFSVGKDFRSNQWYVCERIENAILSFLKEKKLSVYQLQLPKSEPARTCWTDKLLIQTPIEVMNEEIIIDLYEFLLKSDYEKFLTICWYPEKINGITEDDQDLVELATLRYRIYGDSILTLIKQYHPHLLNRVIKGIESDAFREYGI